MYISICLHVYVYVYVWARVVCGVCGLYGVQGAWYGACTGILYNLPSTFTLVIFGFPMA